MAAVWPLVGRSQEVARIVEASGRSPGGALLIGAAGVGKSRLLAEALSACADAGRATVCCFASRSASALPLAALSAAVPDLAVEAIDPPSLLLAAERLLFEQFGEGLVFAVDDAQWLDEVSAALLVQLARRRGVTLLVAARDGEAPAADAVEALWKDELLDRVDLGPLDFDAVGELLEAVLRGLVADRTKREFYARSQGNPLFLRELILDASDHGELTAIDGVWVWSGEVHGSGRLTSLIERRVAGLDAGEVELLELVSLIEPLPVEIAEALVDPRAIERAARRELVIVDTRGLVRLGHPLYGDIIRTRLPVATRRRFVRRLAETMNTSGPVPELLLRLAALSVDNGEAVSVDVLAGGAEQATMRRDPNLGERLARAALVEDPTDFDARYRLGEALEGQGRWGEAEEMLAPLEGLEPDPMWIEKLAQMRARTVFFDPNADRENAKAILARALERVRSTAAGSILVATQGEFAFVEGDCATALALTEPLLHAPDVHPHTRLLAAHVAGMAMAMTDQPLRAAAVAGEFLPLAFATADTLPRAVGWLVLVRWQGLSIGGDFDAALEMCTDLLANDERLVDALSGSLYLFRGRTELMCGHARSAAVALTHAVAELRVSDPRQYLGWALAFLAAARALTGDHTRAAAALDESDRTAAQFAQHGFDADRLLASAWVKACRGEITNGQQLAATLGAAAADLGMTAWALIAFYDAMRLGNRDVCARLIELAPTCDSHFAELAREHAVATLSSEPATLAAAARRLAEKRMHAAAAEAYAEAAAISRSRGLLAAAGEYQANAAVLLNACEGTQTPALRAHDLSAVRLTRRELETAQLAATGATNREIATALITSTRTVEGHLTRAFAKLGINNREELKRALELIRPSPWEMR